MESLPPPQWATHSMRFEYAEFDQDDVESICRQHAEENCPDALDFAIRNIERVGWHGGAFEWFAPAKEA